MRGRLLALAVLAVVLAWRSLERAQLVSLIFDGPERNDWWVRLDASAAQHINPSKENQ